MRFRSKHIADSVTERIQAIAKNIESGTPIPESRGAATVTLQRSENGDLLVTKTFESGEPELLTISGEQPAPQLPDGTTDVTPDVQQEEGPGLAGAQSSGIAEGIAGGGDSLDTLLRN